MSDERDNVGVYDVFRSIVYAIAHGRGDDPDEAVRTFAAGQVAHFGEPCDPDVDGGGGQAQCGRGL